MYMQGGELASEAQTREVTTVEHVTRPFPPSHRGGFSLTLQRNSSILDSLRGVELEVWACASGLGRRTPESEFQSRPPGVEERSRLFDAFVLQAGMSP